MLLLLLLKMLSLLLLLSKLPLILYTLLLNKQLFLPGLLQLDKLSQLLLMASYSSSCSCRVSPCSSHQQNMPAALLGA